MIRGPDPRRAGAALAAQAAIATTMVSNALFDELSFTHVSYLFFFIAAMVVALRVPTPDVAGQRLGALRRRGTLRSTNREKLPSSKTGLPGQLVRDAAPLARSRADGPLSGTRM
jgi:hypothetical protein